MQQLKHTYKGYSIELTPESNYCSAFAIDVRDETGHLLSHVGAAGKTEENAVARGRELIDFEEAYQQH